MKHIILVKWNKEVINKDEIVSAAQSVFEKLLEIDGIHGVNLRKNVIDRANRFDLMICIEMDKEILPIYDESEPHHEWKEKFGKFVENKAIFDFEE
jgi:hypothetical protein